jgi:hypothetical protein
MAETSTTPTNGAGAQAPAGPRPATVGPTLEDVQKLVRELRDAGMESWARIALLVTSSDAYSRASALLAKPGLVATGLARIAAKKAMSEILSRANMPSRTDVLSLSVRLTHIETALDDLGAALEAVRSAAAARPAPPAPPARKPVANGRSPRRPTKPQGA